MPIGRNASGCSQRVARLKKALKNDMDALRKGMPVSDTKVKSGGKRKAEDGEGETPKKRGRGKKAVESDREVKQEATPESEGLGEDGAEAEL